MSSQSGPTERGRRRLGRRGGGDVVVVVAAVVAADAAAIGYATGSWLVVAPSPTENITGP
eukprot:9191274-Pyramimonas_sp.AAC.1